MKTKILFISAIIFITLSTSCARMTMRHDLGDDNVANINVQTQNLEAGKAPVQQTLVGQKAQHVIDGYHSQKEKVKDENLVDTASNNNSN